MQTQAPILIEIQMQAQIQIQMQIWLSIQMLKVILILLLLLISILILIIFGDAYANFYYTFSKYVHTHVYAATSRLTQYDTCYLKLTILGKLNQPAHGPGPNVPIGPWGRGRQQHSEVLEMFGGNLTGKVTSSGVNDAVVQVAHHGTITDTPLL